MQYLFKIFLIAELFYSDVLLERSGQNSFLHNQNDYKLVADRVELSNINREYIVDAKAKTFKYNRTCTAFNISSTYKVDMGDELELVFQAYKFASNEYRLFPLRFQLNLCDMLSVHVLGIDQYGKCGNFTGCPIKKGTTYALCNFTPNTSKFPPLIPNGNYMFVIQFVFHSVEILTAKGYAEVSRPFNGK